MEKQADDGIREFWRYDHGIFLRCAEAIQYTYTYLY